MKDTDAQLMMEGMYSAPPIEEGGGLFSTVTGDPSTWKVGQIIPSQISRDDYDGIILNVGEENGEQTFDVQQVGEEGWTIYTSNLNLPDDDTGRIPPSSKWRDDPTRNPNAPLGADRPEDKWTT